MSGSPLPSARRHHFAAGPFPGFLALPVAGIAARVATVDGDKLSLSQAPQPSFRKGFLLGGLSLSLRRCYYFCGPGDTLSTNGWARSIVEKQLDTPRVLSPSTRGTATGHAVQVPVDPPGVGSGDRADVEGVCDGPRAPGPAKRAVPGVRRDAGGSNLRDATRGGRP